MPDLAAIQALIEEQGRTFEAFKAANDQRLKEIEKGGAPSAESTALVDRLNGEIANLQARITEFENRAARPPAGDGKPDSPEAAAKKAAFLAFLRGEPIPREMRAALVEDATGEILVPEDMDLEITRATAKETVMRQLARIRTTSSNRVRRRSMNELQVGWGKLETGAALVESTLTPAQEYIYVEDLYGLTKIGEDELMDADPDLEQYVNDSFSDAVANAEDTGFVLGAGHASEEPEGALTAAAGIATVAAGQIDAITADDFLNLVYAVPAQYRRNGNFLMASTTELAIRKLKDSNGQYLWQPTLQAGRPNTFLQHGIYNAEDVPAIPSSGGAVRVAAFGDWKRGYMIVDRRGTMVKRLNELYAAEGKVGFIVHRRVGGGVTIADALRVLTVAGA
jgi:HK97 family phage major capsid protein